MRGIYRELMISEKECIVRNGDVLGKFLERERKHLWSMWMFFFFGQKVNVDVEMEKIN